MISKVLLCMFFSITWHLFIVIIKMEKVFGFIICYRIEYNYPFAMSLVSSRYKQNWIDLFIWHITLFSLPYIIGTYYMMTKEKIYLTGTFFVTKNYPYYNFRKITPRDGRCITGWFLYINICTIYSTFVSKDKHMKPSHNSLYRLSSIFIILL